MKDWSERELIKEGYTIQNALITRADLSMANYGSLVLELTLEGSGWGVTFGGEVIGKGYVGAKDDYWEGYSSGIEYIMRIMDVVGAERFKDLEGKYVRVVTKGWGDTVNIIGNIIRNKWFDQKAFFKGDSENE